MLSDHTSADPKSSSAIRLVFSYFISLPFDDRAALLAGNIRAQLAGKGTPIGPYDRQIAAIALGNGLTLVTHNCRELSRVPDLRLEDWLE